MRTRHVILLTCLFACAAFECRTGSAAEPNWYFQEGERAGSLTGEGPLPVYHAVPEHLWNRLFAALYIRRSALPSVPDGEPVPRIEGGDVIDFLAWEGSDYWSTDETLDRISRLLDEFLGERGAALIDDPLKRSVMLRDLWAAFDFLIEQNMRRNGAPQVHRRRSAVCAKLAKAIASLSTPPESLATLPDTYAAAVASGAFAAVQDCEVNNDYLPSGLLTNSNEWIEIDFYQPDMHEDLADRFVTMHARAYRGRSYFRVFYRFPGGRKALSEYLSRLEQQGVDWRQAAQFGFILLNQDAPQIPEGLEVALVQFMMTLDDQLKPVPTLVVESIRHRTYRNVDGSLAPTTNTGVGMHVMEYTLKRHLLFDGLKQGGLAREPEEHPAYRVIFQPADAPDWGLRGRQVLFQQCVDCHMTPSAERTGVHSLVTIVNMGGFDTGAQLGVSHMLEPGQERVHALRAARWKTRHETYRRLLELLGK